MNEKILKKMEDLIENAIDEATKNLTGGNRGVNNKDWHEDVKAIVRLVGASSELGDLINKTQMQPEIVVNATTKEAIREALKMSLKDATKGRLL